MGLVEYIPTDIQILLSGWLLVTALDLAFDFRVTYVMIHISRPNRSTRRQDAIIVNTWTHACWDCLHAAVTVSHDDESRSGCGVGRGWGHWGATAWIGSAVLVPWVDAFSLVRGGWEWLEPWQHGGRIASENFPLWALWAFLHDSVSVFFPTVAE